MVTLDSVCAGTTSLFWRHRDLRAGDSSLTADDLLQKADHYSTVSSTLSSENWGIVSTEIFSVFNWLDKRAFKDLWWMIVYFSLQNTKCWLELPCKTPQRWLFRLLHFFSCLLNWMEKQQSLPIEPTQYHTWSCVLTENLCTNPCKHHHHLK